MRRFFSSVRMQMIVIMLVCSLVPISVLSYFITHTVFADLRRRTDEALRMDVEHAVEMTTARVERIVTLSKDATYSGTLLTYLSRYESGAIGSAEYLRSSRSYLEQKYGREGLLTLAVCFPVDRPAFMSYNRAATDAAMRFQENAMEEILARSKQLDTGSLFIRIGEDTYFVRNLFNTKMQRKAILVLGVDMEGLMLPLTRAAENWEAELDFLLGEAGNRGLDWDELTRGISRNDEAGKALWFMTSAGSGGTELSVLLRARRRTVYSELREFRRIVWAILFFLIVMLLYFLVYVRRRIIRPISQLASAARRIESGELGVTVSVRSRDELSELGRSFSTMSLRIKELIDKNYKEEIALRDARIQAMQSRINPHFINNALEAINWQTRLDGSDAAAEMIEALSVLLNASMARGNRHIVRLSEELEVSRAYVFFCEKRFGDRMSVFTEVEPETRQMHLPLLTMQPIFENAVEHGIAPAGGGALRLCCRAEDGALRIDISNTGRAPDEEDWARIHAALSGDSEGGNHLGVANIAMRLRLIYNGRASIGVHAGENGETIVSMRIPQDMVPEKLASNEQQQPRNGSLNQ